MTPDAMGVLLVLAAALLDQLIGDPRQMLHPVVVMGWIIGRLRYWVERWAGDHPIKLRVGGSLITLILVMGSALTGWCLEQLLWLPSPWRWLGISALTLSLASALAARSLKDSVLAVLNALPSAEEGGLEPARKNLSWIVGRDVQTLDRAGLLRASAETAAENAVDGVFAPLFWMGLGALVWMVLPKGPGPLALAWAFKASSTLDSMLGYRTSRLRWLGTAGARLDDLLTWLPCRLVMLTLPLACPPWTLWAERVQAAERDGAADPSPNAGRSEAIFAHCIGIQLGGENRYGEVLVQKPLLGAGQPTADEPLVRAVLNASSRLEVFWLSALVVIQLAISL